MYSPRGPVQYQGQDRTTLRPRTNPNRSRNEVASPSSRCGVRLGRRGSLPTGHFLKYTQTQRKQKKYLNMVTSAKTNNYGTKTNRVTLGFQAIKQKA